MEFFDYNTYLLGAEEIYALALQYKNGDGVERSDYTVSELFYKAACKGSIRAKADLFEQLIMKSVYVPSSITIEKDFFCPVVEELRKKAKKGDVKAIHLLGYAYLTGKYVEGDFMEAFQYFSMGSDKGDGASSYGLGLIYENGLLKEKDSRMAISYYEKALSEGFLQAGVKLSSLYRAGKVVKKDRRKALDYIRLAADQGHQRAQTAYGRMLLKGILCKRDEKLAFTCFEKAAALGDPEACYCLASMYKDGKGVKKNLTKALHFYIRAGEQEHEEAISELHYLTKEEAFSELCPEDIVLERIGVILIRERRLFPTGYILEKRSERLLDSSDEKDDKILKKKNKALYMRDEIIPTILFLLYVNYDNVNFLRVKDDEESAVKGVRWLSKALECQDPPGIALLGKCYCNAYPVNDYEKSAMLFEKAIEMGYAPAYVGLSDLYWDGLGLDKDRRKALSLLKIAAKKRVGEAAFMLGNLFFKGELLEKNEKAAFLLYKAVAEDKNTEDSIRDKASCNLGYMYENGITVKKNFKEAFKRYERADSVDTAYCNCARLHQKGFRSFYGDDSVSRYEKAIDKGSARAMYNLALYHIRGDRGSQDLEEALSLLNKAVLEDFPYAKLLLAVAYEAGFMVEQDSDKAREFMKELHEAGYEIDDEDYYLECAGEDMILHADYLPNQMYPEYDLIKTGVLSLNFEEE